MSSKACHHPGRIPRGLAEVLRERGESREGGELPTGEGGGVDAWRRLEPVCMGCRWLMRAIGVAIRPNRCINSQATRCQGGGHVVAQKVAGKRKEVKERRKRVGKGIGD